MPTITMQQLQERVHAYAVDTADGYANLKDLRFNTHGCMVYTPKGTTAQMQGNPNDHALSQLIARFDAPPMAWTSNPERCPVELRAILFNHLARDYRPDAGLFIRHKADQIRAVLSSQYTKFDNTTFVDMTAQAIESMGTEVKVLRPQIGDELSAYIMIPSVTFDNDPAYHNPGSSNGGLHPAIYTSNSEIGTGTARINGGLFRDFCQNGAIYGWKDESALAIRHRFLSEFGMRSIIAAGIAEGLKMSEVAAKAYVQAQEIHIEPTNLKTIINEWSTKYGLSVPQKDNWLKALTQETVTQERAEDPRLIDIFNAATYSAQAIESIPAREMVERMAGDMLQVYTNTRQTRRDPRTGNLFR